MRTALIAATIAWALAIPLAAHAASISHAGRGHRHFAVVVYAAGSLVCHQRAERSFHTANVQWPVCARCTGMYVGAAIGAGVLALMHAALGRTRTRSAGWRHRAIQRILRSSDPALDAARRTTTVRLVLGVAALPTVATLAYEWLTGTTPSHAMRAASGALLGAAIAAAILRASGDQVN